MARGGARPGAGRPKGAKSAKAKPITKVAPDIGAAARESQMTPLEYMLAVMNDAEAEAARRDRMAVAAAPFVHPRKEPVGQGKREAAQAAAEAAAQAGGKFAPRAPPRLAAVGGNRVDGAKPGA